jgi:RNA polymerase sigma-54 factor
MKTALSLRPEAKISPRLLLGTRLLQLPGQALEEVVRRELEANPALELGGEAGWPEGRAGDVVTGVSLDGAQIPDRQSIVELLQSELRMSAHGPALEVALDLVYALDDRGYLVCSAGELAREMGVPLGVVEAGIEALQHLEPPGLGARDLRECLLLQCDYLARTGVDCADVRSVLLEAWEAFTRGDVGGIEQDLGLSSDVVAHVREFVRRNLYPHPLAMIATDIGSVACGRPDLVFQRVHGHGRRLSVEVPAARTLDLQISATFSAAAAHPSLARRSAERQWVTRRLERARGFIEALNQRWHTLRRIGTALVVSQEDFLLGASDRPRQLTRRALARDLELHESTVSRAISGKTAQLPGGSVMPLEDLFGAANAAKREMRELLALAGGRVTDREMSEQLNAVGIRVSRRTIAKYRREMGIASRAEERSIWAGGTESRHDGNVVGGAHLGALATAERIPRGRGGGLAVAAGGSQR